MLKSKILFGVLTVFFLPQPCLADDPTGIPDISHSFASIAYDGPGIPALLVVPDGSGNPFTQARIEDGNEVDATITLTILDPLDLPIANYPFEDCWLESMDGGLVPCVGGTTADHNTDPDGITEWVNPLFAGGFSETPVYVMINGEALVTNPGLPLYFNSPDLNGDLAVSLHDVPIFTGDYFGSYHFRSDFHRDGAIDLRDIAILARKMQANCP